VKEGKDGKRNLSIAVISFVALLSISILINIYLYVKYDVNLISNFNTAFFIILISLFIGFLIFIIMVMVYLVKYVKRKSEGLPNVLYVFLFPFCFGLTVFVFLMWVFPLGEKIDYANDMNSVADIFAASETDDEVDIAFLGSSRDCLKCRGKMNIRYDNRFYIQNNLQETKQVWVELEALDKEENVLKTVQSNKETLEPKQYTLVTTEETSTNKNIWEYQSFKTDAPIDSYRYHYYYEDPGS